MDNLIHSMHGFLKQQAVYYCTHECTKIIICTSGVSVGKPQIMSVATVTPGTLHEQSIKKITHDTHHNDIIVRQVSHSHLTHINVLSMPVQTQYIHKCTINASADTIHT